MRIEKSTIQPRRWVVKWGAQNKYLVYANSLAISITKKGIEIERIYKNGSLAFYVSDKTLTGHAKRAISRTGETIEAIQFAYEIAKLAYKQDFMGIVNTFASMGHAEAHHAIENNNLNTKAISISTDYKRNEVTRTWRLK